jgi:hypothetical protein
MQTLNFYTNQNLRNLARDTLQAKSFRHPYTDKITKKLGVWLVKDDGIYLMNAFKLGKTETPTSMNYTSYANGYNPNCYDSNDLWERTHKFSRDDFAEFIQLNKRQLIDLKFGYSLQLNIYEEFYETITLRPSNKEIELQHERLQNA